ncbi:MAG: hydrogenase expression/formation protein HypE [Thermoanaerobacteraceae bacterium]|nr:hydrogenase expression/formation protein HypE [Thermoanaerobacteraceae bacterium]
MDQERILLAHGSGGRQTQELIEKIIYPIFEANGGQPLLDAALLPAPGGAGLALTTDSFVVSPLFFPGGDIGKLAACGTINDLAVVGARPLYLTVGLIIEEGFAVADLKRILTSLAEVAKSAGVSVVAGDTKVVERGNADKLYINTTGIGVVAPGVALGPERIAEGDLIIVSGTVGDHGMTILCQREGLPLEAEVASDCAALHDLARALIATGGISCMRDPTRGGLATALNELAAQSGTVMEISEEKVPVQPPVAAGCGMLGLDPLYLANEGKLLITVRPDCGEAVMSVLVKHPLGKRARVIGRVTGRDGRGKVLLETGLGVRRILPGLEGEHLPRIC